MNFGASEVDIDDKEEVDDKFPCFSVRQVARVQEK
jgi:hypothetical protein